MPPEAIALLAGFVIAAVTAPVGVSGAVFLLPVQLSVLDVPNPQVTPTNLLFNVISGPGALVRFLRRRQFDVALTRALVLGSGPGVVVGAWLRVYVADDPTVFRVVAAAVLLPTGLFILARTRPRPPADPDATSTLDERSGLRSRTITVLAFVVGVAGGIYGIGGGSILGPVLVGTGMAVARVAPAALASTFVTSIVGVVTYALLAIGAPGTIAPDWSLGIAAGIGGLAGGYAGAHLQPHLPETLLRVLLGTLAVVLAFAYLVQALA